MASTLNAIFHGENSTAQAIWHPNPTVRGTWNIYQTCVVVCHLIIISSLFTIFLCVWQAIHLNIPPPGEPPYKQILRRIGWSVLAIIAPEVVALNAWLQYRKAKSLMLSVNYSRGMPPKEAPRNWPEWLHSKLRLIGMPVSLVADRLRMLLRDDPNISVVSQMDDDKLPWAMDTAFYALCGGGTIKSTGKWPQALDFSAWEHLARHDPKCLLPLQRAVLQDPSKASGLTKLIVCAQAIWFCSQCITRLALNMAISLLELNTFAHCISAFFVYTFWWDKPYDVATHVYIKTEQAWHLGKSRWFLHLRSRNMARGMFDPFHWAMAGVLMPLIMVLTFLVYGALHALAWEYQFPTRIEGTIWKCASVATASSGLIVLLKVLDGNHPPVFVREALRPIIFLLLFTTMVARFFLVVESFRALPNSPASIYQVPRWTAYFPHI